MGKQSKRDKKDIEFLDAELSKNLTAIVTPKSLWILMFAVGCMTAGLPIGLFFTSFYSVNTLMEGAPFFAVGLIIGSLVLASAYEKWAVFVRKQLHSEREVAISNKSKEESELLRKSSFVESTSIAMFSMNLAYIIFYLIFSTYILPGYNVDDKLNYALSSIFASGSSWSFARVYHSIKL